MNISLTKIEFHGSRQGRATNWQVWPGFGIIHLSNGKTIYLTDVDAREDKALAVAKAKGVDTSEYERKRAEWVKEHSYPAKPEGAELYQHNYGYEKPVELGEWSWSTTFGRWARLVTFADGWHGVTFPKL
jgi:hypothetical protein